MKITVIMVLAGVLLTFTATAQKSNPWFLETAIRFTGDAELYVLGPSASIGLGRYVGDSWSLSSSFTYFNWKRSYSVTNYDLYKALSIDLVTNYHFSGKGKGFFIGGGLALQKRNEVCASERHIPEAPSGIVETNETYLTAVIDHGYQFPVMIKKKARHVAIDLKLIGPHPDLTEIFTQLMLGVRFRY